METGYSGLHHIICCFIMLYYPHPLNPPPTAHPFDEYPVRLDIDMMRLREIYMYIYILFLYTILRIYDYIYIYIYIYKTFGTAESGIPKEAHHMFMLCIYICK